MLVRGKTRGWRFSNVHQYHVTLKFLDEINDNQKSEIDSALKDLMIAGRLELSLGHFGLFPLSGPPRVLWLGIEGRESLTELQRQLEERLEKAGFPKEKRDFHAHLTLARLSGNADPHALRFFLGTPPGIPGTWPAGTVKLYRSELWPDGPEYTEIGRYPILESPGADHGA